MNLITFSFILISVFLSIVAQILLKHGMSNNSVQAGLNDSDFNTIFTIITNISIIGGLAAYVTSAGVWLLVLSKVDVSKAYPFVGLGFIGTMLFANWFLNEPLTATKIIGTSLILLGVILVSR